MLVDLHQGKFSTICLWNIWILHVQALSAQLWGLEVY